MGTHPIFESDFDCLTVPFGFGKKKVMNFFKQQFTSRLAEVTGNFSEKKEERNPFFNQFAEEAGDFLQKYAPEGVDATELIEMAINAAGDFDWGSIFTPDLIDDCEGYDPDYFGEDGGDEEVEKTEEELAEEDDLWDGENIEDEDAEIDFDDKRFRRKNGTYNDAAIEWTAPENPQFIVDGMSMNDIKQNGIGDCWFLASLASLAQRNERVSFVIQKQRNEQATPDMGYVFKFFRMGKWMSYKVDKYLPTTIAAIAADNEHWVPYCEKAYAKRYKTYENITGGWGAWGLTDLTGGIAIKTELDWNAPGIHELFAWLYDHQDKVLVTSGINGGDGGAGGEVLQDNGLFAGHEYSLLKLEMVKTDDGRMVQLLNIRNPWGQGEFNGDWSDHSDKWDMVSPERRDQLLVTRQDGAFWMCYKDWVNMFSSFDVCLLPTEFSERKNGPIFPHECCVRGNFEEGTPKIKVKLQVTAKTNVYVQTLLDCCVGEAKSEQFMMVNFKDGDGNLISPRLPNNYKPSCASNYSQNGYLFNLAEGDYTIIIVSYLLSTQAPGVVDGRKWMIRTVSPHVSLQKM